MDDPTREPRSDPTPTEPPETSGDALAAAESAAESEAESVAESEATAATESVPAAPEPIAAAVPPPVPPPAVDAWASGGQPAAPPSPPPTAWESPEDVVGPAPGYVFGGAGERLIAYIVDGLLISLIAVVGFVLGTILVVIFWPLGLIVYLATPIVCLAYFPWFWHRTGQTPGLRMFGMRVVRDSDGGPVSVGAALLRLVGYWIDSLVFYLGFIWIFIDKRKRCWHDLIAGTVVIKRM